MIGKVEWQALRMTRAGLIWYCVFSQGGPEPYGIAVCSAKQLVQQPGVTAHRGQAVAWGRRLAAGRVRPCHLREMLCDWLCE